MNIKTVSYLKIIYLLSTSFIINALPPSDSFTALVSPPPAPKPVVEIPEKKSVSPATTIDTTNVAKERTIQLHNSITDEMRQKKHFFRTFIPSKFTTFVNGKEFKQDENMSILIKGNRLMVSFEYEFLIKELNNKKIAGSHEITLELDPKQNNFDLTFTWDGKQHLLMDKADAILIK